MAGRVRNRRYGTGQCDRCGFVFKLKHLRYEWTGLKVCGACWDPLPAQLFPRPFGADREQLDDPRPWNDQPASLGKAIGEYQIIGRAWQGTDLAITGTGATRA